MSIQKGDVVKNWLPLSEYSTKYKVSISTLRRRIKSDEVIYCFEEGKYLLKDTPLDEHSKKMVSRPQGSVAPPPQGKEPRSNNLSEESGVIKENIPPSGGPFLSAAQEMLSELKKAYSIILQEKEKIRKAEENKNKKN